MPRTMLWAWEEPEDLRRADPRRLGVAFLAERVFLGKNVVIFPRRQQILVPRGIWAEAVIRIQIAPGFEDSAAMRQNAADAILHAARLPGVRGIQVDFDVPASQHAFYSDLLRRLRSALPTGERLEMTALVSWCAQSEGWMHGLPVDEAVPMYFRLGKHVGRWGVREPLCATSAGVSTDEQIADSQIPGLGSRRPAGTGRTVYVFAPRPWTPEQLALLNQGDIPLDERGAR